MAHNFKELFTHLEKVVAPSGLSEMILIRHKKLMIRKARQQLFFTASIATVSLCAFVPALISLYRSVLTSGFLEFSRLAISDASFSFVNFKDIAYPILESVPVYGAILCLSLLLVFFYTSMKTAVNVRRGFLIA